MIARDAKSVSRPRLTSQLGPLHRGRHSCRRGACGVDEDALPASFSSFCSAATSPSPERPAAFSPARGQSMRARQAQHLPRKWQRNWRCFEWRCHSPLIDWDVTMRSGENDDRHGCRVASLLRAQRPLSQAPFSFCLVMRASRMCGYHFAYSSSPACTMAWIA